MSEGTRRRLAGGSMLGAAVLLALALGGMLNYLAWKYHLRGDWTSSQIYSLSERSRQVVDALDKELDIVVFMRSGEALYEPVRELLARYEAASPRIRVRTVDPERNLAEAQRLVDQYALTRGNVIVFQSGEDRRVVESADLADYDFSGAQFGEAPQLRGFKGEQLFTSAILELTEGYKPKVVFTTGHGEASLDDASPDGLSQLQELLGRDNFELEEWRSLGQSTVPADTDLVVVASPNARFTPPELDLFDDFLGVGGRMMILLDPLLPGQAVVDTGLEDWLVDYGVRVGRDIALDPRNQVPFFGAESFFVTEYGSHPVTEALQGMGAPVIVSLARSVGPSDEPGDYRVIRLLETSGGGWAKTDLDDLTVLERGDADLPGPVSLAVAVETTGGAGVESDADPWDEPLPDEGSSGEAPGAGQRLIVVGDSDLLTNRGLPNAGNPTFALNAINWMVEREQLLGIPPKEPEQVRLNLSRGQLQGIFWFVVAGLPLIAMAMGTVVYLRRRR